jgi:hypothetical protein
MQAMQFRAMMAECDRQAATRIGMSKVNFYRVTDVYRELDGWLQSKL